jgi:cytochrome c553
VTYHRIIAWALLCLGTLPAFADDLNTQIQEGRQKARPCTTCHGLDGLRQGGEMPTIGGRDYFDLLYQMGRFRRADRFQPAMTALLQTYDIADMADVAAYFASMGRAKLARPGPYQP